MQVCLLKNLIYTYITNSYLKYAIGYEIGGYGSCKGDSGGPIAYFSTEERLGQYRFIQLGIAQGGIGACGDPTLPAIYVRLEDKEVFQFINKSNLI